MSSDSEEDAFDDASAAGSPPTDDGDATGSAEDDAVSLPRGGPFLEEMEGVVTQVAGLEELECCSKRRFIGKRDAMIYFFLSLTRMTKNERQVSLLSVLSVSAAVSDKASGSRDRFPYYLLLWVLYVRPGHTKNAFDRGFGIIKRHMRRESCWTMDTLVEDVERATENVSVVNLEEEEKPFWASKSFFAARYRKVAGIQKYHIFRITREKSGFVECKETPASKGVWIRLHKDKEPKTQSLADFLSAWSVVPKANDKPLNPEKVSDIYSKVLPFVPSQFTDDPIYMKPSARMIETAQEIKRSRRSKADKTRKEREEVGVSVDDDEGKEAVV
ncbi:uncharacterized protein KRP23_5540 [Phytophthora ramorum]|uniref:uncharacterized protein n=1 Tax=Phytophthora ramorum TaxID=164328 RepID=UPI00309551D7|nr:hypothetical protein KRP23_5540 [Phytophthora ramorum]